MPSEFTHLIPMFDEMADKAAEQPCLIFDGGEVSHGDLRRRAREIAAALEAVGVKPGDTVAYRAGRTPDLLATALGVLSAGAAYAFVDPAYPAERSRQLLTHLKPFCLVTEVPEPELGDISPRRVVLSALASHGDVDRWPAGWREVTREDPLHIVYTSGSTGAPRGVVIPHRAVMNRLAWMWRAYPFQPGDVACWHKSPALVASPWEMFGALLRGLPSLLLHPDTVVDARLLWRALVEGRVTHFLAAPALIEGLLAEAETEPGEHSALRLVSSSAEAISPETVHRFRRRFPGVLLLNMYGVTECASNVAAFDTAGLRPGAARVPIGRPVAGSRIVVADGRLRPVPIGVEGSMLVGGDCLATGYLGDEELTARRFVTHDFGDGRPVRMYQTGDRARLLPDGSLDYLGRTDDQVQVRGFRVELGDIRAALERYPAVSAAVVRVRADGTGGTRLVAYVAGEEPFELPGLRRFAAEQLPRFMLPNEYVVLDQMPLTRGGKADMAALDAIEVPAGPAAAEYEAPHTPAEEIIAGIWAQILGRERVGVTENFFDIGGHSLLGARMLARLRTTFGVPLSVRTVFDRPTVAGLAEAVEEELISELESIQAQR